MSFNLQKSEEQASSSKRSHFDLAKNEGADIQTENKKKPYWIYAGIALLLVGSAAWYVLSRSGGGNAFQNDTAAVAVARTDGNAASRDTTLTSKTEAMSNSATGRDSLLMPSADAIADGNSQTDRTPSKGLAKAQSTSRFIAAIFKAGSTQPLLSKNVVKEMKLQSESSDRKLEVWGYASSEGDLAYNQAISQARADAYKKYLISKGVKASLVTAQGKGIDDPIASNDTEAGRRKNRRVEIHYNN